jgi:sulfur carrier protein ThiS adenylyltransferase
MNQLESGLSRYLSAPDLARIRALRVGIAGAGGLGSNCAWMLTRSGFSDFVIVDHDVVEPSNLNRQFFFPRQIGQPKVTALRDNLLDINPDASITAIQAEVTPDNVASLFAECHVVIEAFDQAQAKKMLVEAYMARDVFLVAASGLAGCGNADAIVTQRIRKSFYMVGDFATEAGPQNPPLAPKVTLAAAKQADLVLAFALGRLT